MDAARRLRLSLSQPASNTTCKRWRFATLKAPARVLSAGAMSKLLRGLAAGWGAKKMGGGCLSTIVIFVILWWLLGNFEIFR